MSAAAATTSLDLPEIARMDLRTSRSGDTATTAILRALGLQYRYQPARLAIARSLALPTEPAALDNMDGKAIRGETLFGSAPEEIGLWVSLLMTRDPGATSTRRALQERIALHWARGAGLLWEGLRGTEDAPALLAAQVLRGRR